MSVQEFQRGEQNGLYVNTGTYAAPVWTELDIVESVELKDSVAKNTINVRRYARLGLQGASFGNKEWGASVTLFVPATGVTDAAYNALETARKNRTTVDILLVHGGVISTDGLDAERGAVGVFEGAKTQPSDGTESKQTLDLSFMSTTDQPVVEYGTTLAGAFDAA